MGASGWGAPCVLPRDREARRSQPHDLLEGSTARSWVILPPQQGREQAVWAWEVKKPLQKVMQSDKQFTL